MAVSREEPHPKLRPATMKSPFFTSCAYCGRCSMKAILPSSARSIVMLCLPGVIRSVFIASANFQTLPIKSLLLVQVFPWVCYFPLKCACCRGCRGGKVYFCLWGAHPAREISVARAHAHIVVVKHSHVPP